MVLYTSSTIGLVKNGLYHIIVYIIYNPIFDYFFDLKTGVY